MGKSDMSKLGIKGGWKLEFGRLFTTVFVLVPSTISSIYMYGNYCTNTDVLGPAPSQDWEPALTQTMSGTRHDDDTSLNQLILGPWVCQASRLRHYDAPVEGPGYVGTISLSFFHEYDPHTVSHCVVTVMVAPDWFEQRVP